VKFSGNIFRRRAVEAAADAAVADAETVAEPPKAPVMSQALPFMEWPVNLQGYDAAGNYGFDPVGFTNWIDVRSK
jgi:hypothetical protein